MSKNTVFNKLTHYKQQENNIKLKKKREIYSQMTNLVALLNILKFQLFFKFGRVLDPFRSSFVKFKKKTIKTMTNNLSI